MARKGYRPPGIGGTGLLEAFADSYNDGAIRALAQEPVQNSFDARHLQQTVHVDYRLMPRMNAVGERFYVLTVTDHGTTGLCGEINPTGGDLTRATEAERQELKWYHFERWFDSNKGRKQIGSRGWGTSIFLHCSRLPGKQRSMMLYDTRLNGGEYRFSDITIWDDDFGVREVPLLDDEARRAVSAREFETADHKFTLAMGLRPLDRIGTRVIVPYLSEPLIQAFRDGQLSSWLQYLWWRPIAEGHLVISIIDEETDTSRLVAEPEWWADDIWSSDATTPGKLHKLHKGCWMRTYENEGLSENCMVKRLALQYDAGLRDRSTPDEGIDYAGVQVFRAGQCIETFAEFDLFPSDEKRGLRAFVEFDGSADALLRDNTQHTRLRRSGIFKQLIMPYLKSKVDDFAIDIGLIKAPNTSDSEPSEAEQRTSQFVFDKLLAGATGDAPNEYSGDLAEGNSDRPWQVDIHLTYPDSKTSRVNWGERITGIRLAVNSRPENLRRNTRCAIEWQAPGAKYKALLSKPFKNNDAEHGLGYRVLTERESSGTNEIVCPEPGVYRIRAAVYEGKRLVAKKARRIHVQMDPPERQERPYSVSISVENENAPGELRIENGDILRLQINGRNRTREALSGPPLAPDARGSDPRIRPSFPHAWQSARRGRSPPQAACHACSRGTRRSGRLKQIVKGKWHCHLAAGARSGMCFKHIFLDGNEVAAFGTHTLHFESEPEKKHGANPFELQKIHSGAPPMWELDRKESKLKFPAMHPLYAEAESVVATDSAVSHNAFTLEITINGLLAWALEPLMEDDRDATNIEFAPRKAGRPCG